jgi:threonine dehydrogenase-like Zn-dependent dehydrogenase
MNRLLTIKSGQCRDLHYLQRLLAYTENGDLDPTFITIHTLPLEQATHGYDIFRNKHDHCERVVVTA